MLARVANARHLQRIRRPNSGTHRAVFHSAVDHTQGTKRAQFIAVNPGHFVPRTLDTFGGDPGHFWYRTGPALRDLSLKTLRMTNGLGSQQRQPRDTPAAYERRWKHATLFTKGYVPVPKAFFDSLWMLRPPITPTRALVLLHLMSFKWTEQSPYVGQAKLAKRLGLSTKMVARHLHQLEKDRYVRIERRHGRSSVLHLDGFLDALNAAAQHPGVLRFTSQVETNRGAA